MRVTLKLHPGMYCHAIHAAPWMQLLEGGKGFWLSPQQAGTQSGSFAMVQPAGQHPSPAAHWPIGALPTQAPLLHVSTVVQASPSSHAPPWFAGTPPTHLPAAQASPAVHAFLSSQGMPSLPGTAV